MASGQAQVATSDRFWLRVHEEGDCLIWQGTPNHNGYGVYWFSPAERAYFGRRYLLAHRMSLILDGRPPGDQMALHHCDVKLCVRPEHLYVGTARDNMEDRADRNPGSWPTGENNPAHKLTDQERDEVRARRAAGETLRAIGQDYGISHTAVRLTCL